MPVSFGIAPRIGGTHARQFSSGSQGQYSLWWRAAEPKSHRIGSSPAREQREADVLVALPRPDRGTGQVAEVVRVEQEERAEIRFLQRRLRTGHSMAAQPVEVDPLLPVDRHPSRRAMRCSWHSLRRVQ